MGAVNAARTAEATARTNLNNEITAWLTVPGTPNFLTPDADFARMAKVDAPVALFPVRLETRFGVDRRRRPNRSSTCVSTRTSSSPTSTSAS